jgi:hypothetical protein
MIGWSALPTIAIDAIAQWAQVAPGPLRNAYFRSKTSLPNPPVKRAGVS